MQAQGERGANRIDRMGKMGIGIQGLGIGKLGLGTIATLY